MFHGCYTGNVSVRPAPLPVSGSCSAGITGTNEIKPIDPRLLDLLHAITQTLETSRPFHIVSGYRSPVTNARLRANGGLNTGVARHSLHMDGKAADIRVPGTALAALRPVATRVKKGGVGYYPALQFVHVDTGRVRYWQGAAVRRQASRSSTCGTRRQSKSESRPGPRASTAARARAAASRSPATSTCWHTGANGRRYCEPRVSM
jgi:hypothetical protein